MRGLSAGHDSDHTDDGTGKAPGRVLAAGTTATAVLAAIGLFTAGCSTGGTGTRDEGAARNEQGASSAVPAPTGPSPVEKVDAVRMIMNDPKVGQRVKEDLKPCAADAYPVDTSYGNLTDTGVPDVVVNVLTCGDAVGIGTYVYRLQGSAYTNVFAVEEPAVYSAIDRGDLVVTKQVYAKGDPVAYPSGEDVITYRWAGGRFTEHDRVHNVFGRTAGDGGTDGSAPSVPSEN